MKDHNKILEEYIENGCKGDLDLSESKIESPPDNLEVGGNLSLYDCRNLTSIGDNIKVGGYLELSWIKNLTSIGDNLKVGGMLNLGVCENLTSIGDNIEVGGNLNLCFCTSLTSISGNLKVDGNLYLNNSKIKTLPPTLQVKRNIIVNEDFNVNPYRKGILFIKAMEGEQVPFIEGEIIVTQ